MVSSLKVPLRRMEYDGITGFCETFFSGHQGCHKVSAQHLVSKSSKPTPFRCFRKFPANQETLVDLLDVDTLLPAETQARAIWNWSSPDTSHWCSRLFWEQSIIHLFRATQSLSTLATYPYSPYDLVFAKIWHTEIGKDTAKKGPFVYTNSAFLSCPWSSTPKCFHVLWCSFYRKSAPLMTCTNWEVEKLFEMFQQILPWSVLISQ